MYTFSKKKNNSKTQNNDFNNSNKNMYTWNNISSNINKGPVVPIIIRGWPESNENIIPQTAVPIKVSETPIFISVLSAILEK